MLKRYLVFAGLVHYASGGWEDFGLQTDDLEEARTFADKWIEDEPRKWAHVVDTHLGMLVYEVEGCI